MQQTQTQTSNVFGVKCLQIFSTSLGWPLSVHQKKIYEIFSPGLQSRHRLWFESTLPHSLKGYIETHKYSTKPEMLWALSLRLQTFNISYLSLHLKACVSMWCANKQKKKKPCEEILACEDLENVDGVRWFNTKQEGVWKFAGALIMPQIHCYVVLYIRLWMWALQVPPGLRAVGWIFLQHQYLQCWQLIAAPACLKRPWPAELWTLYHVHSTWTVTSLLHWSAV